MEGIKRNTFQGVINIIRFNWHFYVIAVSLIIILFFAKNYLPYPLTGIASIILILAVLGIVISLLVSFYIYDISGLYSLNWLNSHDITAGKKLININAGFDETSVVIAAKYPRSDLSVFDFYDPAKHTEISIERARKAYPPFPGTKLISTNAVPLPPHSVDYIFLLFAAHEIRDHSERIHFFTQLSNTLNINGKIIIAEHQRDVYNFLAYNIGFFHFLSGKTWDETFTKAGLLKESETKLTPFISLFVLTKNGTGT